MVTMGWASSLDALAAAETFDQVWRLLFAAQSRLATPYRGALRLDLQRMSLHGRFCCGSRR